MKYDILTLALSLCLPALSAPAQETGTASGKGTIDRSLPGKTAGPTAEVYETVSFSPHFSCAFREGQGATAATWIVLTEKQPPLKEWLAAAEKLEALHLWCGKEKASFAAVSLDEKMDVDFYFLCPANGRVSSQGLNVANGLESIVLKFQTRDARHLKGTLRTGEGSCPGPNGTQVYCKPTGDFAFDAPVAVDQR
jgi:hypothetical protein